MSVWSIILFVLAALYAVGAIFEFPIFFEGNPKTRWLMAKVGGKRNWKIVLLVLAVILLILAVLLR